MTMGMEYLLCSCSDFFNSKIEPAPEWAQQNTESGVQGEHKDVEDGSDGTMTMGIRIQCGFQ